MSCIRRLAMDLGFSGWLWHRYEVWICHKAPNGRWAMGDYYDNAGLKFTRRGALRFAWRAVAESPFRIELVDLGSGKHEVVRESVVAAPTLEDREADLEKIRANVLSFIDASAPGKGGVLPWSFNKGYADCRRVVDRAFDRQIRQRQ